MLVAIGTPTFTDGICVLPKHVKNVRSMRIDVAPLPPPHDCESS
jgi:hypothetical protein